MPSRALRFCGHPGCEELVEDGRYCTVHQAQHQEDQKQKARQFDKERGTPAERGYDSRWRKARTTFLKHHPLCAECERQGRLTPATVVDHIIPHKGDKALFWQHSNWQPLCKKCHDTKTAREDGGFANRGVGG